MNEEVIVMIDAGGIGMAIAAIPVEGDRYPSHQ
jgi:hypothetical protein